MEKYICMYEIVPKKYKSGIPSDKLDQYFKKHKKYLEQFSELEIVDTVIQWDDEEHTKAYIGYEVTINKDQYREVNDKICNGTYRSGLFITNS